MSKFDKVSLVAAIVFGCLFTYLGYLVWTEPVETYRDTTCASVEQYREVMDQATAFEKAGDLELREHIRRFLEDGMLSVADYYDLQQKGAAIELRYLKRYFEDGTYRYMEPDGIGRNLPKPGKKGQVGEVPN